MKFHQIEPASLRFPRSLIVRAMRGQSETSSPSKQIIIIFRAVTNKIKITTCKRKLRSTNLLQFYGIFCKQFAFTKFLFMNMINYE
jgi:hypothetical protein